MQDHSADGLSSVSQSKINSLFIHPNHSDWEIDQTKLINILHHIGLISDEVPNTDSSFYAGEHFLNHITFLGCAPTIQFSASDDKPNFCFIRLISSRNTKMIQTKTLQRAPHCPHCKKILKRWFELNLNAPLTCPHCLKSENAGDYDWRRTAGFARIFIEITDIYPKEALPQSSLLEKLAQLTHEQWDYFYYCA